MYIKSTENQAYAATPAILGAFSVFQTGVIDRENKATPRATLYQSET